MAPASARLVVDGPKGRGDRMSVPGREPVTLLTTLGIEIVETSKTRVVARMPVGPAVYQPFGLLHGGASVALAETVASAGPWVNGDPDNERGFGPEVKAKYPPS